MTLPQNITDMLDDFAFLDDWEDRYMHLIELGKKLPSLTDAEKNSHNKVNGCVSQVWLIAERTHDNDITFRGDSDAHIVKGLVAIVLEIFSGRTAREILEMDAPAILGQLGLAEHLSPQRSNGLGAMIERIKNDARAVLG